MLSLNKRTGNTSTGLHMAQRSGNGFRFRCNTATIKRFASVEVKPEQLHLFGADSNGVFISARYGSIDECATALCEFIERVTGIACGYTLTTFQN